MAQLDDLIPVVQEKCQGVLDYMALTHLKKAFKTFCQNSGYFTKEVSVTTDQNAQVKISAPFGYFVDALNFVDDERGDEIKNGQGYTFDGSYLHTGNANQILTVNYSIVPTIPVEDGFDVPDDIINRWADELAAGAASTLCKIPNLGCYDLNMSDYYDREFTEGYREAFNRKVELISERHVNTVSDREFI